MSPLGSPFATETIVVVEPSLVDDRGTQFPDWSTPLSEVTVQGCSVQPGASEEVLTARQGVSIRWTVFAPRDTPVTAHSGVRYEGRLYGVDGEPQRWPASLTGEVDHLVLHLVDWQG